LKTPFSGYYGSIAQPRFRISLVTGHSATAYLKGKFKNSMKREHAELLNNDFRSATRKSIMQFCSTFSFLRRDFFSSSEKKSQHKA